MRMHRLLRGLVVATVLSAGWGCENPNTLRKSPHELSVERTRRHVEYLASDELEGRGPGTRGIDLAADYIAGQLKTMGLKPVRGADGYFQHFKMRGEARIGPETALSLGSNRLELDRDFRPMPISKSGEFSGPVTFVGYGIRHKERNYDDYADIDVKGRVVLAMRFEPHDAEGRSRLVDPTTQPAHGSGGGGGDWSSHSAIQEKAAAAAAAGAVALLLVNPPNYHGNEDRLTPFRRVPRVSAPIPVIHISRAAADQLLSEGGLRDLQSLQATIDAEFTPASAHFDDQIVVSGKIDILQTMLPVKNVVAALPGFGFGADEWIVVGAHYDHLGYGARGAMPTTGPATRSVYNGADDNASGTAAVLEIAQRLVERKSRLPRSVLFVFFSGEEAGLLGSDHFVSNPLVPLDKIIAMLNLDMVGRVQNETLAVGGQETARRFDSLVKELDSASPLRFSTMSRNIFGRSDHASFMTRKIPVLFFSSGQHLDYHRPTDDTEKINFEGLAHVVDVAVELVKAWSVMPRQQYTGGAPTRPATDPATRQGARPQLGVMPSYTEDESGPEGLRIAGAVPGTAAAAAGLREGDIIQRVNGRPITGVEDLQLLLDQARVGEKWMLHIIRGGEPINVELTLRARSSED
ncbi:MAG: M20/M25/M40 family metallo-hydrolase [Phycisphaerae bacterium]|nr:M20/M25/M40 family metallo-hydrolase [Phycisphaerae bacterium]MDW8262900.1 M20/M25/M40 family metallo-hydrolase [Phycisphaerales bacterium]